MQQHGTTDHGDGSPKQPVTVTAPVMRVPETLDRQKDKQRGRQAPEPGEKSRRLRGMEKEKVMDMIKQHAK